LPLLARLAPKSRVLGIALAGGDWPAASASPRADGVREIAARAALLLISSDMNHFATDDENRRLDEIASRRLKSWIRKRP